MTTAQTGQAASHKRTSSVAENASAPESKRQQHDASVSLLHSSANPTLSTVYVVVVDQSDPYIEPSSDIHGIYATITDANNAVRRLANDYTCDDLITTGVNSDGFVYWSCSDVGEGGSANIHIQKFRVKPPGLEPECVLENIGEPGSEEREAESLDDDDEEEEEEEEDEDKEGD